MSHAVIIILLQKHKTLTQNPKCTQQWTNKYQCAGSGGVLKYFGLFWPIRDTFTLFTLFWDGCIILIILYSLAEPLKLRAVCGSWPRHSWHHLTWSLQDHRQSPLIKSTFARQISFDVGQTFRCIWWSTTYTSYRQMQLGRETAIWMSAWFVSSAFPNLSRRRISEFMFVFVWRIFLSVSVSFCCRKCKENFADLRTVLDRGRFGTSQMGWGIGGHNSSWGDRGHNIQLN